MAARKPRKAKAEPEVAAANDKAANDAASQGATPAAAPAPTEAEIALETMIRLAHTTLRGDIRDALLAYQKHEKNPLPWHMRGETAQKDAIRKADEFATDLIERMARIVIAGGRETVDVQLEQVVIKDGLKGVITCPATAQNRHLLGDAQGQVVTLAFVSTLPFDGERSKPKVDRDQKALFDDTDAEMPDHTDAASTSQPPGLPRRSDPPAQDEPKPTDDQGGGGETPKDKPEQDEDGPEPSDA